MTQEQESANDMINRLFGQPLTLLNPRTLEWKFFHENVIVWCSLQAAFQHANVYQKTANDDQRSEIRRFVGQQLASYLRLSPILSEVHFGNISSLADTVSARFSGRNVLAGDRFRIGIAQKALNLYLKYFWCMSRIPEPPHCPFDSNIIWEIRQYLEKDKEYSWTKLDNMDDYRSLVEAAQKVAGRESLAKWELGVWENSVK